MSLSDALFQDAVPVNVWIANRTDGVVGFGTAQDPFNGGTKRYPAVSISLSLTSHPSGREAQATLLSGTSPFVEGDVVAISGVTGPQTEPWNGIHGIYNVTSNGFNYLLRKTALSPQGSPIAVRLTFPFDEVMRNAPSTTRIQLGAGVFQTRGFAPNDSRGWQPKTGQRIVGAGMDITTLQLVGAENTDQHYHVIGMPIEPAQGSTNPIAPLESFEVADLTIDCNTDNQPGRPDPGYAAVACGAVRILGNHCLVKQIKAINWGTKSFKQGCFVISIIQASARPNAEDGSPIVTEKDNNGIQDCTVLHPSKNNARETTVLHIGGLKNASNHAQAFGRAAYIRRNFVDCMFHSSANLTAVPPIPSMPFPSAFVTSKSGTQIVGNVGTFVGKRLHFRKAADVGTYIRLFNTRDSLSRWNGYFPITAVTPDDTLVVDLSASQGTTNDSSFVIMGTEFRGIAVSSGIAAVVEQNQIHNCWIGGPYSSPLDDNVSEPTSPPTLDREEHLDPLNALNIRSLIVRENIYRDVAVGPYWNMGGVSGPVPVSMIYNAQTGVVNSSTSPKTVPNPITGSPPNPLAPPNSKRTGSTGRIGSASNPGWKSGKAGRRFGRLTENPSPVALSRHRLQECDQRPNHAVNQHVARRVVFHNRRR